MDITEERLYATFMDRISACMNYERTTTVTYTSRHFDLEQFQEFLHTIGSPHHSFPSILVTGTAGKGSTAAMIGRMLTAGGYRVGLFISPHVVDIRERIGIGDVLISTADLAGLGHRVMDADHFHTGNSKGSRTFFEVLTAIAFLYFQQQRVDIAVIEVGVGGRLDATNVVKPLVSIITPVDLDHTHWLGATRPHIAREKAGIIHPGSTLITAKQRKSVNRVLAGRVGELQVPWLAAGRDFAVRQCRRIAVRDPEMLTFDYEGPRRIERLSLGHNAPYQLDNAAVAITAVLTLERHGFPTGDDPIRQALQAFHFPARFQSLFLRHRETDISRRIVIDGAHNPLSIRTLLKSVSVTFGERPVAVVFACARDKDAASMLELIGRFVQRSGCSLHVTTFTHHRARTTKDLLSIASSARSIVAHERPADAIRDAMTSLPSQGIVLVCGSFFLAGEVLALIADNILFEQSTPR